MKTTPITNKVELDKFNTPKDPWKFAREIESSQGRSNDYKSNHSILFNKGRYFETTLYSKKLTASIAQAIKVKTQYGMVVASWKHLESFVKAMNKRGYYIKINIDWI